MRSSKWLSLLVAFTLPSCVLYDQALIDDSTGAVVGDGGTAAVGGSGVGGDFGTGGTVGGGTGGMIGSGGIDGATGGAGASDSGGTGGDISTGGGGTGGDSATGGSGTGGDSGCGGPPDDFTGISESELIDNFDNDSPRLTNGTSAWGGNWSTNANDTTLTPLAATSELWTDYPGYEVYVPCAGGTDLALHVIAKGSDSWGISFDAKLKGGGGDVDASQYDGVIFWAKSINSTKVRLGFTSSPNAPNGSEAVLPPLPPQWTQKKIPFPNDVDQTKIAIVKIVGFNFPIDSSIDIDFWIENISFYKD